MRLRLSILSTLGLAVGAVLFFALGSLSGREVNRKYLPHGVLDYSPGTGTGDGHGPLHPLFKSHPERVEFMLKMIVSDLVQPVPNHCIDRLHKQLKTGKDLRPRGAQPFAAQSDPANPANPTADGDGVDPCESALMSCGNCHLPQVNNCNYDVYYQPSPGATVKRFAARIIKSDASGIVARELTEGPQKTLRIPADRVVRSVWRNGEDPLHVWWNFHAFGKKGETAAKMLDIVHKHKVACANCHVKHGDFRLTAEGKEFKTSGKVIKRVPL